MRKSSLNPESRLRTPEVTSWLRKRYFKASKEQYLLKDQERRKAEEIREVFRGFDYDGSGYLELKELWAMFMQYGLKVERKDIRELFAVIKPVYRDKLSLAEFQDFALSEEANQKFHKIMHKAKLIEQRKPREQQKFIPTDISCMMKHLIYLTRTQQLLQQIGARSIKHDIECFQQIFSLKPSNLETPATTVSSTPSSPRHHKLRTFEDYRTRLQKRILKASEDGRVTAITQIKRGRSLSMLPSPVESLPYLAKLKIRSESSKTLLAATLRPRRLISAVYS